MPSSFCDFLDRLYAASAGADNRNTLAGEIYTFLGPQTSVTGLTLKIFDAGETRHSRSRE